MLKNKISALTIGVAAMAMVLGAFPAAAQTTSVTASVTATSPGAAARLAAVITKANTAITSRITALTSLNTRVQALKNESATEKASIAAQVQTNITGLNALQTKIDADTDVTTARSDAQTIFTTFRIYALIVPQGWILASADRVTTITGLMNAVGTKIQTRINADQSAGDNVSTITTAFNDMSAKVSDANAQVTSVQAGISGLVPDQGNTTVAASNKAALVAARADIKTATQDLKTARQDITTVLKGLKALGSPTSTSAAATTTVQ